MVLKSSSVKHSQLGKLKVAIPTGTSVIKNKTEAIRKNQSTVCRVQVSNSWSAYRCYTYAHMDGRKTGNLHFHAAAIVESFSTGETS